MCGEKAAHHQFKDTFSHLLLVFVLLKWKLHLLVWKAQQVLGGDHVVFLLVHMLGTA